MTPRSTRPSGTPYRPSCGLFMAKSQRACTYTLMYLAAPAESPPLVRRGPAHSRTYGAWRWRRAALPDPGSVSAGKGSR